MQYLGLIEEALPPHRHLARMLHEAMPANSSDGRGSILSISYNKKPIEVRPIKWGFGLSQKDLRVGELPAPEHISLHCDSRRDGEAEFQTRRLLLFKCSVWHLKHTFIYLFIFIWMSRRRRRRSNAACGEHSEWHILKFFPQPLFFFSAMSDCIRPESSPLSISETFFDTPLDFLFREIFAIVPNVVFHKAPNVFCRLEKRVERRLKE